MQETTVHSQPRFYAVPLKSSKVQGQKREVGHALTPNPTTACEKAAMSHGRGLARNPLGQERLQSPGGRAGKRFSSFPAGRRPPTAGYVPGPEKTLG